MIAITGTAANLAGIVGGIIVFGDPLSANPIALAAQCMAFAFVLIAAWLMPAPMRTAAPGAAARACRRQPPAAAEPRGAWRAARRTVPPPLVPLMRPARAAHPLPDRHAQNKRGARRAERPSPLLVYVRSIGCAMRDN